MALSADFRAVPVARKARGHEMSPRLGRRGIEHGLALPEASRAIHPEPLPV